MRNFSIMERFRRLRAWLQYRYRAKTEFSIHSPFLFEFVTEVINDRKKYPEYRLAEQLKEKLIRNKGLMHRRDFGALDRGPVHQDKISCIARRHAVRRLYGRLLFRLSRSYRPKTILELGTSLGISTLYLALGNRGARVITLEGCQETAALAEKNFSALKLNNVTLVTGKFSEALPDVLLSLQTADMVFIDGDHRKEALLEYFTLIIPYIHSDSVVVVDDIRWSPEMAEAWAEICTHQKVKVSVDLFQMGILFFKEELSKQDFVIRYS